MTCCHTCIVLGMAALLRVLVDRWLVVGGLLRGRMHGVLRVLSVLSIQVLRQVAACIRNVVHAACTGSSSEDCHAFQVLWW